MELRKTGAHEMRKIWYVWTETGLKGRTFQAGINTSRDAKTGEKHRSRANLKGVGDQIFKL